VPLLVLANIIGCVHIVVEIWLAAGLLAGLLVPRMARLYCLTLGVMLVSRLAYGGACPLTVWQEALKHHPVVQPLLATHWSVEVPSTWMGIHLNGPQTHLLVIGAFIVSLLLVWLRPTGSSRTERLTE